MGSFASAGDMAHPGGLSGLLQVYLVNVQFP